MAKILEVELETVSIAGNDVIVNRALSWDVFICNK